MPQTAPTAAPPISIFISYSRADFAFADAIYQALEARGCKVCIDRSDIQKCEEWWKRIVDLIVDSTIVIFIISPNSLASPVCHDEVTLTKRLGKRIVPLMWRRAPGLQVPDGLSERDWVFLNQLSCMMMPQPGTSMLVLFKAEFSSSMRQSILTMSSGSGNRRNGPSVL